VLRQSRQNVSQHLCYSYSASSCRHQNPTEVGTLNWF
jgi:hypothetical protein